MPKGGLALALIVTLGLAAVALFGFSSSRVRVVVIATPEALTEGDYVIPTGREAEVVRWLRPLAELVAPLDVAGYSIQKTAIRVQLSDGGSPAIPCSGNPWASAPGALVVTRVAPSVDDLETHTAQVGRTRVASVACNTSAPVVTPGSVRALAEKLDATYTADIWARAEIRGARVEREPVGGMASGFLGVTPQLLSIVTLAFAFALALAIGAMAAFREGALVSMALPKVQARIGWAVLAGGLVSRVVVAGASAFDIDESCAIPPAGPLQMFTTEHDALVHPPLARAVFHTWSRVVGLTDDSPDWLLRVPSLVASSVALVLVALIVMRVGKTHWRWLPLAVVALQPTVVTDSVLARPYSLACLLVVVTIFCVWPQPSSTKVQNGVRWGISVLAATLAAWTDVLAGAAALGAIAIACIQSPVRPHRWVALAAAGVGIYALAPGIGDAVANGIAPPLPGYVPDLRPNVIGLGRAEFVSALLRLSSIAALGTNAGGGTGVAAIFIVVWAVYGAFDRQHPYLLWSVLGVAALALTDTFLVGMRPRNVLFLPFGTAVALAMCADPLVAWLRQLKRFRRAESG